MCGIFGLIVRPNSKIRTNTISKIIREIAVLSESRGKDSSGIAFRNENDESIKIIKGDVRIKDLILSHNFKFQLDESIKAYQAGHGFSAFGHSRLVTNGSQLVEENNQPVIKDGIVLIHNGIIVNVGELWLKNPDLNRKYHIDTEIIPTLIRKEVNNQNDLTNAISLALRKLEGTYSIASMFEDLDQFVLATNNGSLYYISDSENIVVFTSEKYFLETIKNKRFFYDLGKASAIIKVEPNMGLIINLKTLSQNSFDIKRNNPVVSKINIPNSYKIEKQILDNTSTKNEVIIDPTIYINNSKENRLFNLLENNAKAINKLRRCTKCLLPETFPYITYDIHGVCNYCNNYRAQIQVNNLELLKVLVEPYRRKDKTPDCIVPFSGGRDSTYSLHIVKNKLGLNPIAFTYDWGMVTDLARRNIARVCAKLGVENIIVSANIKWKRENIRKNISAWLKNPSLGMIPLFMAGDKYFFYYCNQLKKQTGIDLNIWGINYLENTEFKTGFAGLPPQFDKERIYSLSIKNQIKLFGFVASNIIRSPGYINQSVFDSFGSFAVRYISPKKDYYHLFDYYRWDENEINEIIKKEYKWETALDTKSTWRIGDGTASFYNYIYYTVAGFSENDTFRSNQIREGMLSRDKAMRLIEEENLPRYETLRWYLEIIGLDFAKIIEAVNRIPKLYPL